jgi:threonine/homoserine/homoserine lactone efflux protein
MSFLAFLLEAVLISLSGVMAPGPVTTLVVGKGNESPHAGALVALGHGIVELPLMIGVFYGVDHLLERPHARAIIALVGGLFLLGMGIDMLRSLTQQTLKAHGSNHSPVVGGLLVTIGNPYFLVWWATVGAALILRSVRFGLLGFLAFALAHWSCDFVWDTLLSALSFKGGQVFGRRFQRAVLLICGGFLIFFGGRFVYDGASTLLG